MILTARKAGILLDYVNETDQPRDVTYASLTAPAVTSLRIYIDGVLVEHVYVGPGCSHSWWTPAGGKFIPPDAAPSGIAPGSRLLIHCDGECALRIDWT